MPGSTLLLDLLRPEVLDAIASAEPRGANLVCGSAPFTCEVDVGTGIIKKWKLGEGPLRWDVTSSKNASGGIVRCNIHKGLSTHANQCGGCEEVEFCGNCACGTYSGDLRGYKGTFCPDCREVRGPSGEEAWRCVLVSKNIDRAGLADLREELNHVPAVTRTLGVLQCMDTAIVHLDQTRSSLDLLAKIIIETRAKELV